jgi:ATP-binding cassette subfamily B protein
LGNPSGEFDGGSGTVVRDAGVMVARGWRERALVRMGPYLRPYRRHLAIIIASSIVSSAGQVAIPLIVKTVIDGPLQDGDHAGVARWAAITAAIAVVEIGLAYTRRYLLAVLATELETTLRDDLYAQLQRLDVGFHDQWQSGQLLSRAMTDLSIIRRFIGFGAVFFVLIAVQVLAIFGVLLTLHVPLALLTFAAAVPVIVLCQRFERRYFAIVRDIQDQTGDLTTTLEEAARGIRVLKAFGRGSEAFTGYDKQCRQLHATQLARIKLHTRFVWVLGTIPNLTLTAVLLAGVLAVGSGALTIGGLVAFVSYVLMLVFPLEVLAWIMAMAGEAETAAVRVYEVFDTEPLIADRPGAVAVDDVRGEVRFEAVTFCYAGSERPALHDIDLVVHPGETLAVVGATGCGKTTLVTLLTRLYDPTAGRITVDGLDLRDLTVNSLRSHVGVAFEDPSLFSASVRENLLMGKFDATEEEIHGALRAVQAQFALNLPWGLDTRIGEQGLSLSGGQRQRLALARAIIGRPRILVLDDPLSAVDVHTEALVQAALRPILADCTALVVAHRPSTVALADRVALLDDGRLIAVGTHHHLLETDTRYRAVLSEAAEDEGADDDTVVTR